MSWTYDSLLLPLCQPDLYRGLGRRLREVKRFDRLPRREQLAAQEQRMRALLDHAYETCPYYRMVFDSICFRAADWRQGQPIPIPALEPEQQRRLESDLYSRAFEGDLAEQNAETTRAEAAMQFYFDRACGWEPRMRTLRLVDGDRPAEQDASWLARFCDETVLGHVYNCADEPRERRFAAILERLNRSEAETICGSPRTLAALADWLRSAGRSWHKPRLVIATPKPPSAHDRWLLEDTFDCTVTAQYGTRGTGLLAAECREGRRLHFHPWICHVDLTPAAESSSIPICRLVLTDVVHRKMPLIRFEAAECAVYDESLCACGSWYPSVTSILPLTAAAERPSRKRAAGNVIPYPAAAIPQMPSPDATNAGQDSASAA